MNADITLTAPHMWMSRMVKALTLSCDSTRDAGDSTSFLSCVHLSVSEDGTTMICESAESTTAVTIETEDEDIDVSGSGECLIVMRTLSGYVSQMPSDRDVKIIVDLEAHEFSVSSEDDEVTFTGVLADFSDSDRAPRGAEDFDNEDLVMDIESATLLRDAYRFGSSMAHPADKDALAGQDPKSGCVMTMDSEGLQMFSLFSSASERFLPGKAEPMDDSVDDIPDSVRCLSWPALTIARLGVLSGPVRVGIGPGKRLAVSDRHLHIDISPLSIGNRSDSLSSSTVLSVLNPLWDARVVSVRTSAKEFFAALSRAGSLSSSKVNLHITDTQIVLSSTSGQSFSFSQKLICSTQWMDEDEHVVDLAVNVDTVRKLSALTGKEESLLFDISFRNDKPWGIVVHDKDYDPDSPHDFFMLVAEAAQ